MKAYFEKNYNGEPYDALGRRKNQELHYILGGGKIAAPAKKSEGGVSAMQPKPAAARAPVAAASSGAGAGSGIGGGAPKTIGGSVGGGSAQVK